MKRCSGILLLLCCFLRVAAQYGYDTVKVYFPINISNLDQAARTRLDSVVRVAGQRNILVYGFADYLGTEPSNNVLALRRARTVKAYLLSRKIPARQIPICDGIGEVKRVSRDHPDGMPEDRRVSLFLKRSVARPAPPATKIRVQELDGKAMPTVLERRDPTPAPTPEVPKKETKTPAPASKSRFEQLTRLKPGQALRIETIYFQPTRHFITPESEPILEELYRTMEAHKTLRIRIEGHVCCIRITDDDALDTDTQRLNLSEARARFIYDYLVSKGIEPQRLEYAGYGKRKAIIPVEQTEEDAKVNRRVEFRVLAN